MSKNNYDKITCPPPPPSNTIQKGDPTGEIVVMLLVAVGVPFVSGVIVGFGWGLLW